MAFTPSNNGQSNQPKKNPFRFSLWWMYAIVLLFLGGIFYFDNNSVTKQVNYSTFERYVEVDHGITKIVVFSDKKMVEGYLTDSLAQMIFKGSNYKAGQNIPAKVEANIPSADKLSEKIEQWRQSGAFTGEVEFEQASQFGNILWSILPLSLIHI